VVGRYVVLRELGAGGMGVVYAAYDPELDRKVALKLLRASEGGTGTGAGTRTSAHGRLLREAKALAQLSHPNVVAVHDVGEHEGRVYLAMEFVEGKTLGSWAKARRRRWQEVLEVYLAAGRGLAAAHACGLVHRDVKPENLVLGKDGRVRVLDFGLVRLRSRGPNRPIQEHRGAGTGAGTESGTATGGGGGTAAGTGTGRATGAEAGTGSGLEAALTEAGALMGTPAYMAPEQFAGGEVGPAADQFSFCVSLWEGLYGQRPFAGNTPATVAFQVLRGKVRRPPAERKVPSWLRRVLERGLSVAPRRRFPSLEALLEALEKGQARSRLQKAAAGTVALGVALVGAEGARRWNHARKVAACEATAGEMAEAWNDEVARAVKAGLVGTDVSYAADTAARVVTDLSRQAAAWRSARVEACLAAEVEGRWTPELYARACWCLEDRRLELAALAKELSAPPRDTARTVVQKAVKAAAGLTRVGSCMDERRLAYLPDPPPPQRAKILAEVRRKLSEAAAKRWSGQYREGLAVAQAALSEAQALGWPPLSAQAQGEVGRLLGRTANYDEAASMLTEAYFASATDGSWETAARAATSLVFTVGRQKAEHEAGLSWGKHAEVALARLGEPEAGLRRAPLHNNIAIVHVERGGYLEAQALYERALDIWEKSLGPEHPHVATILNNLAIVHRTYGAYEQARALSERALALRQKTLGPDHPDVAQTLNNLANIHRDRGAYAEAKVLYERALSILETAQGSQHPTVAYLLNNLGDLYLASGAPAEAHERYQHALEIFVNKLGPDHPNVAWCLNNLAEVYRYQGAYAKAQDFGERSFELWSKVLGPNHVDVTYPLISLAKTHLAQGRFKKARTAFERALTIREEALGPEHVSVAEPLVGLAEVALARRDSARARRLAQRAVSIREKAKARPEELAKARFVLARALWTAPRAKGRDRSRSLALARTALSGFEAAGKAGAKARDEVRAFLARHDPASARTEGP